MGGGIDGHPDSYAFLSVVFFVFQQVFPMKKPDNVRPFRLPSDKHNEKNTGGSGDQEKKIQSTGNIERLAASTRIKRVVECAFCGTQFKLEETRIPDAGIYARCIRCGNRFFIAKEGETKENAPGEGDSLKRCRKCGTGLIPGKNTDSQGDFGFCEKCIHLIETGPVSEKAKSGWFTKPSLEEEKKEKKQKTSKTRLLKKSITLIPNLIFSPVLGIFSHDLAVDLGTANTLIYEKGKGIVLNEPSVVAIRKDLPPGKNVVAVGMDAKKMIGRTPGYIETIRPLRDGVIHDFLVAGRMLSHFIGKVITEKTLLRPRPRIIIAIPSGTTSVEQKAVKEAAELAGAREAYLIEESMAAAIGSDLPFTEPRCSMVVDIGGGTTEVAVISLAGIVHSRSLRIAGDKMDNAIIQHIRRKFNILIGESTAELVKIRIGDACPDPGHPDIMEIRGRDLKTGIPKIITIDSYEIWHSISELINEIAETVTQVLEQIPPELSADAVETGIVLTGGVALLKNLDSLLHKQTGLPIHIAEEPLLTVALGSGKTLESMSILKQVASR